MAVPVSARRNIAMIQNSFLFTPNINRSELSELSHNFI
jgi:hypothetical protein